MIIIVQPYSKWSTHQEVNAGWLHHVGSTYPHQQLVFVSTWSHWWRVRASLLGSPRRNKLIWVPQYAKSFLRTVAWGVGEAWPHMKISVIFLSDPKKRGDYRFPESLQRLNARIYVVLHQELEEKREVPMGALSAVREAVLSRPRVRPRVPVTYNLENVAFVWSNSIKRFRLALGVKKSRGLANSDSPLVTNQSVTKIVLSHHISAGREVPSVVPVLMPFSVYQPQSFDLGKRSLESNRMTLAMIGNGNHENALKIFEGLFTAPAQKDRGRSVHFKALTMNSRGFDRFLQVKSFKWGRIPRKVVWRELNDVEFLVFGYSEHQFKASASGAQMEILRTGIPHISLRNPHLEELHQIFGELGTICENLEEIVQTIEVFANDRNFASETFARQHANILHAQEVYPKIVVRDLKNCMG